MARGLWLSFLIWLALCSAATAQSALDGTFTLASSRSTRAAIREAIATATSALSDAERVRWRAQLEELARPSARLVLQRSGAQFRVNAGQRVQLRSATDGTREALAGDWALEQRLQDNVLEQRIDKGPVQQVYRYSISADRHTLTVDVRITVTGISRPITYQLRYEKQT